MAETFEGIFARYQPLTGRDWLRSVSEEDRKAFGVLGWNVTLERGIKWQSMGGKAAAAKLKRIPKGMPGAGRFIKSGSESEAGDKC